MSNKKAALPTKMFLLMSCMSPGRVGVIEKRRATAARQFYIPNDWYAHHTRKIVIVTYNAFPISVATIRVIHRWNVNITAVDSPVLHKR
jgi:hypothetical protein